MTTALRIPTEILDIEVAELLKVTPGLQAITELREINPHQLSSAGKVDYLAAIDRQESWFYAWKQEVLVAIAGEEPHEGSGIFGGVDDEEREDIATALRLSPTAAQNRIDVARVLVGHLPNTISALSTGEISSLHATVIARETATAIRNGLSEDAVFRVEQTALAHAEFHTPGQVAAKVKTTVARLAPEDFEEIVDRARDTRRVTYYPEADGMATVVAILPAEDAQTVMKSIEAFILKKDSEEAAEWSILNADMKRADAFTAIASQALASMADEIRPHRRPITISVAIDLPTLLGLAENPGQLAGYGAIPASVARKLAADGNWQRFVSDPTTGNLLDFGREKYTPPQELVDYLLARDRVCRFPGCRRTGQSSDIDHAHSWESGGETNPANLGLLCRRHHRMKTHGGWSLVSNPDGSCLWKSPKGKSFFVPARPFLDAV